MEQVLQQVVQGLQVLQEEVNTLKQANATANATSSNTIHSPMHHDTYEEIADDEDDEEPRFGWESVLGSAVRQPTSEAGKALAMLLTAPPPLERLKELGATTTRYAGVPPTPLSRRNRVDRNLWQAQSKIEQCLHCMLDSADSETTQAMAQAAAWARSAWEDLQQQRRSFYAGKQAYKLDARTDDTRPRLLTTEESSKIRPAESLQTRPSFWGEFRGPRRDGKGKGNARSPSFPPKPRGKGKGKGRASP